MNTGHVKVKICGITTPRQGWECVEAGADAIGLVFYPGSPRYVNVETAKQICQAAAGVVACVGVFVNEQPAVILDIAYSTGIDVVQLHGDEQPETAGFISSHGIKVVKAFFGNREPAFEQSDKFDVDGYLAECPGEVLPGGTGKAWDWSLVTRYKWPGPLILAGGLEPDNVSRAVTMADPWGVDVSSGVEKSPGVKDMELVRKFIRQARGDVPATNLRRFL